MRVSGMTERAATRDVMRRGDRGLAGLCQGGKDGKAVPMERYTGGSVAVGKVVTAGCGGEGRASPGNW